MIYDEAVKAITAERVASLLESLAKALREEPANAYARSRREREGR